MFGPVLDLELRVGTRRGKLDVLRRVYAGWLVVQFFMFVTSPITKHATFPRKPFHEELLSSIGPYLELLVGQHFLLMVLVTPTFVAGAIADEKSRGTLQHL